MSKFKKYGGKVSFNVGDEEITINRVKTEKIQELMNYTEDPKTMMTNIVEFFVKIIKKNYPEESDDDVLGFVQSNAMKILEEFQIAYGLVSRKDLEEAKENAKKDADGKIE